MSFVIFSAFIVFSAPLAPPLKSHAYLDPGSGSFILQILIASLVGAAFVLKAYWRKIISLFRHDQVIEEPTATAEDDHRNE